MTRGTTPGTTLVLNRAPMDRSSLPTPHTPASMPARPWADAGLPRPASIPGMLTRDERDHLAWLAADTPTGRIVELGCFLGCATAALLAGLAERDRRLGRTDPRARLIAHDSFVMPRGGGGSWAPGVREGEWFGDIFDANIAPHACIGQGAESEPRLHVRHGWIPDEGETRPELGLYAEQEHIDALVIDISHSFGLHATILRTFAPFVPLRGVLVQQDFKSWRPWLFLHMWQLRDQFEPTHDVPGGAISFTRRVAPRTEEPWTPQTFPQERFDEIWDQVEASWRSFGSGQAGVHAALARGRHAISLGNQRHALECFDRAAVLRRALLANPEFDPWRDAFETTWNDGLAAVRRRLERGGAAPATIERATRAA